MSARTHPTQPQRALYAPRNGELVRDLTTGRTGTYQGPGYEAKPTVFLRPPGGGCEWEVSAYDIEPAPPGADLEPTA
ncbi:hypothetical protein [Kitasatospora viridis]|uniref:Uncharacterized protein n=1 Tax=Kitasatospora viridis TaxID=281105 RepID=A0A561ULR2_9ACTN|nr:hypothetical protein [Kitasatospora viridis]TWG00290.1 hypothetical protein FHX73_114164 [Kitasatospora viridis]